jgi:beta-N-acetylhexosaminidase
MRAVVEEVGQRFAVGFDGRTVSSEIRTLIREFGVGHVVLRAANVEGPEQLAELVRELQMLARQAGHPAPLLVAAERDEKGALPLPPPWTTWPPLRALLRIERDAEKWTSRLAEAIAGELTPFGVHADFAPDLDLDTSADPDKAARVGAAFVETVQRRRVAACAQHFPGQGAAEGDVRSEPVIVSESRRRLDDLELRPFRHAIASGVAMMLTSHARFTDLDEDLPATVSRRCVHELLRTELGFGGIIVANDLDAVALAEVGTIGERAVKSAAAGCDVFRMVSARVEMQIEALESLVRATEGGAFRFNERDEVRRRVRGLKERMLLPYADPDPRRAPRFAGPPEHHALALEIADRSGVAV